MPATVTLEFGFESRADTCARRNFQRIAVIVCYVFRNGKT